MNIIYVDADNNLKEQIALQWSKYFPDIKRYVHLENRYTVLAMDTQNIVGIIGIKWKNLSPSLNDITEAFIDIIDVLPAYRRRGIATQLVQEAEKRAGSRACQLRAWSSEDKIEAISMWKALGFGLCPATTISGKTGENINGYFVTRAIKD